MKMAPVSYQGNGLGSPYFLSSPSPGWMPKNQISQGQQGHKLSGSSSGTISILLCVEGVLASHKSEGKSRLHYSLAVCPWENYFTSLGLCLLIYKTGLMYSAYFVELL